MEAVTAASSSEASGHASRVMTSSAGGSGRVTDEEDWTTVGDGDTAKDGGAGNGVAVVVGEEPNCEAVGDGNTAVGGSLTGAPDCTSIGEGHTDEAAEERGASTGVGGSLRFGFGPACGGNGVDLLIFRRHPGNPFPLLETAVDIVVEVDDDDDVGEIDAVVVIVDVIIVVVISVFAVEEDETAIGVRDEDVETTDVAAADVAATDIAATDVAATDVAAVVVAATDVAATVSTVSDVAKSNDLS